MSQMGLIPVIELPHPRVQESIKLSLGEKKTVLQDSSYFKPISCSIHRLTSVAIPLDQLKLNVPSLFSPESKIS